LATPCDLNLPSRVALVCNDREVIHLGRLIADPSDDSVLDAPSAFA